ncbi:MULTISPECIES: class I SAM-dependent methyltransferase [unclassified Marinobacter]|uniref:class I SAM-dependent methyltransferase n=1 Tax=unclassified Marinobacter TaxID=83889 RepID=UPI001926964E|nr:MULTISPECIES: class I SAM-dependent methyltransferase [unclassified Marinobacter]MBL3826673.1 class I SAM-dependent methyltransferase [Marinobacter sp. MC3]MBL3895118.1 class I SAM-dependent methyltransferase [Marinobacter sp. MW3]
MSSSVNFWNRSAARYARRPISDQNAYLRKIALTQKYFHPEMDVLEFGCGTGSTALIHAPRVRSYLATDASSRMIDIARERMAGNTLNNLRFVVATLEDMQHRQQAFDAILGLNILHLLRDPESAINQVFSMLKPGGVFVSNTACLQDTRPYLKPVACLARLLRFAPYVKFVSRRQLEMHLENAGFQIGCRWVPENSKDVYFLIAKKPK